ncbi:MAG TPA: hypothetical protein VKZ50_04630 [bacterium]|nr:hypothetical protein [bacterium]
MSVPTHSLGDTAIEECTRVHREPRRERKNRIERKVVELLETQGWRLAFRGWSDFCGWWSVKGGRFACFVVRAKRSHRLRREQKRILYTLAKLGIDCYLVDLDEDDDGTARIVYEKLGPRSEHLD